jgi:APA family basic amino acid/polyamine antiporter
VIAAVIILTGSFKEIFVYTAFILQLFASLQSLQCISLKEDRESSNPMLFTFFRPFFIIQWIYPLFYFDP